MKNLLSICSAIILLFSLTILSSEEVQARFGGGHSSSSRSSSSRSSSSRSSRSSSSRSSYSSSSHRSSSSHSSSSSTGDDIGGFVFIIFMVFLLFIIWIIYTNQPKTIISQSPVNRFDENQLIKFKQQDANFSRTVFLDFVHLLYVKYYRYYGKKEFSYLTPYLYDSARQDKMLDLLIGNEVIIIDEIVINSVRLFSVGRTVEEDRIGVEIESNFTIYPAFHNQDTGEQVSYARYSIGRAIDEDGKQHTRYARSERWFFQRKKALLSLAPEKMQALTCPACGSPAHFTDTGECPSCRTVINKGQQQWYVKERVVLNQTVLSSGYLVAYAEEQGTQLPTITSPTLLQEITEFEKQHTVVWSDYWNTFKQQIVQSYFVALNSAWTNHDLTKVRHLISDRLYEANSFWMELYKHYHFNNRLDHLTIQDICVVKIELDKYYETITVRIFASCFDYTEDSDNKIIAGSKRKRRTYTEYWTFARRAGIEQNENTFNLNTCPQCGAAADKMGQTAICEYCGSKISTGEFSWVLFLITQDENYCG